jgi:hypothetical protein
VSWTTCKQQQWPAVNLALPAESTLPWTHYRVTCKAYWVANLLATLLLVLLYLLAWSVSTCAMSQGRWCMTGNLKPL